MDLVISAQHGLPLLGSLCSGAPDWVDHDFIKSIWQSEVLPNQSMLLPPPLCSRQEKVWDLDCYHSILNYHVLCPWRLIWHMLKVEVILDILLIPQLSCWEDATHRVSVPDIVQTFAAF